MCDSIVVQVSVIRGDKNTPALDLLQLTFQLIIDHAIGCSRVRLAQARPVTIEEAFRCLSIITYLRRTMSRRTTLKVSCRVMSVFQSFTLTLSISQRQGRVGQGRIGSRQNRQRGGACRRWEREGCGLVLFYNLSIMKQIFILFCFWASNATISDHKRKSHPSTSERLHFFNLLCFVLFCFFYSYANIFNWKSINTFSSHLTIAFTIQQRDGIVLLPCPFSLPKAKLIKPKLVPYPLHDRPFPTSLCAGYWIGASGFSLSGSLSLSLSLFSYLCLSVRHAEAPQLCVGLEQCALTWTDRWRIDPSAECSCLQGANVLRGRERERQRKRGTKYDDYYFYYCVYTFHSRTNGRSGSILYTNSTTTTAVPLSIKVSPHRAMPRHAFVRDCLSGRTIIRK